MAEPVGRSSRRLETNWTRIVGFEAGTKIPSGTHLGKISGEAPEKKNYASEKKELLKELKDAHDRWSEMVGFSAR